MLTINLYVSRTPLQLLNCIEARDRFHRDAGAANVLLLTYRKPADRRLSEQLLDNSWDRIVHLQINLFSRYFYPALLPLKLGRHSRINFYYTAWLKHLHAHIFNTWHPAHTRLIDDGNEILSLSTRLEQGKLFADRPTPWLDRLLRRRRAVAADTRPEYFSLYALPWVPPERHVLNDYRMLRAKSKHLAQRDLVLFIGSHTYPKHVQDPLIFQGLLQRVRTHFGNRKILYVLHRYEDARCIKPLTESLGFEMIRFDTILECVPLIQGWLPREIATFNSSAADTLRQLYDLPVTIFEIALSRLGPNSDRDKWRQLFGELAARHPQFIRDDGQPLP